MFSPEGLRSLYEVREREASFTEATRGLLGLKLPHEIIAEGDLAKARDKGEKKGKKENQKKKRRKREKRENVTEKMGCNFLFIVYFFIYFCSFALV